MQRDALRGRSPLMGGKESGKSKDPAKKAKSTPKKERQISLRLNDKAARRLNKLMEKTEWSVTQVIEQALKVYAAHEGIILDDKAELQDQDGTDTLKITA
jgi:hypothetical protein